MDNATRNRLAIAMLVLAKVVGVAGLVVGTTDRIVGGTLLALDGGLLVGALALCLHNMKKQTSEEKGQKDVLEQMMREGTLDQFLREVRERAERPLAVTRGSAPSSQPALALAED